MNKPINLILNAVYDIFDKYEDGDCINPYLNDRNLREFGLQHLMYDWELR